MAPQRHGSCPSHPHLDRASTRGTSSPRVQPQPYLAELCIYLALEMMHRIYLDGLQTQKWRWELLHSCRANPPFVLTCAQELLLHFTDSCQTSIFLISMHNGVIHAQDVQSTQTASRGNQQGSNLTKHTLNCKQRDNPATACPARVDLPIGVWAPDRQSRNN